MVNTEEKEEEEVSEGIEQDTVAQHEHEWHATARPLTSLHWSGN